MAVAAALRRSGKYKMISVFSILLDIDATQIVDVATTIIFDPACNRQDEIKNPG